VGGGKFEAARESVMAALSHAENTRNSVDSKGVAMVAGMQPGFLPAETYRAILRVLDSTADRPGSEAEMHLLRALIQLRLAQSDSSADPDFSEVRVALDQAKVGLNALAAEVLAEEMHGLISAMIQGAPKNDSAFDGLLETAKARFPGQVTSWKRAALLRSLALELDGE